MSLYLYKCQDCGQEFEEIVSIKCCDTYKAPCVYCSSQNTKRQIAKTEFVLKGDNWAKDSYGLKEKVVNEK